MNPYVDYPALDSETSIQERTRSFTRACLAAMKQGHAEKVLYHAPGMIQDAIEAEQYEFAEGIKRAVEKFQANPQLSMF